MTAPLLRARGLVRRFRGPRPAPFAAPGWTTALDDVDLAAAWETHKAALTQARSPRARRAGRAPQAD